MSRAQYFVVLHDNKWKIKFNGKHIGPFDSQRAAITDAVKAAQKTGMDGNDAQVLVQGENHLFRTEWTYGHDPCPPSG
jgi:hypothetical protein